LADAENLKGELRIAAASKYDFLVQLGQEMN
jgi:hypothetical protein